MTDEIIRKVSLVLASHYKKDIYGCVCGWRELGESLMKHQAEMLREAGLLKED